MIPLARLLGIVALYVSAPFYGLWLMGGKIADVREKRARDRCLAISSTVL